MEDLRHEHWKLEAACKGKAYDPKGRDLFFGDDVNEAKRICADCPVRLECLDYAIRNSIEDGVWGGQTYQERERPSRPAFDAAFGVAQELEEMWIG